MTGRTAAGAALWLLLVAVLAPSGCSRTASDEEGDRPVESNRIDPRLQRVMEAAPDSVVGVFVRTREDVGADRREELEDAGLRVGTVAGRIVTGRLAARDAARLARVPFVTYIELSRRIPVPQPPADVPPDTPDGD